MNALLDCKKNCYNTLDYTKECIDSIRKNSLESSREIVIVDNASNDYGLRVLQAGYKNILCHNSFILHFGSKSFEKEADTFKNILDINKKKFYEKWGLRLD